MACVALPTACNAPLCPTLTIILFCKGCRSRCHGLRGTSEIRTVNTLPILWCTAGVSHGDWGCLQERTGLPHPNQPSLCFSVSRVFSCSSSCGHPAVFGGYIRGGVRCTQAPLGPVLRHRVRRESIFHVHTELSYTRCSRGARGQSFSSVAFRVHSSLYPTHEDAYFLVVAVSSTQAQDTILPDGIRRSCYRVSMVHVTFSMCLLRCHSSPCGGSYFF